MEKLKECMKNIFMTQPAWQDSTGAGHYVMKRRLKTWVKALIGSCVAAALVAAWGWNSGKDVTVEQEHDVKTINAPAEPADKPKTEKPPAGPVLIAVKPLAPLSIEPAVRTANTEKPENETLLTFVPGEIKVEITKEDLTEGTEDKKKDKRKTIKTNAKDEKPRQEKDIPARQNPYWIHISKGNYKLSLYKGDDLVKTYSVAVGENPGNKRYVGDHRTPVGNFRVVSIEDSSTWKHDFGDGKGKIAGAYGPWFIRLDTGGWKGIGIHGTHDPDSRGTMATEGCIRLSNDEISDLRRYAYRNMRVVIEE